MWDVAVVASFYKSITSVTPCRAAEAAALRRRATYADIIQLHIFITVAIETLKSINMDGQCFLDSLGERFSSFSSNPRENTFL